jgi:N-acetyl-anhydromuramyl-L-alanine amidase AmpD
VGDACNAAPTESQMQELTGLVHKLQQRYGITPEHVLLYSDPVSGRGRLFPVDWFRQQLLSPSNP